MDGRKGQAGADAESPVAGLEGAAEAASRAGGLPPVDLWDPPFCGDIDMRIARDGSWHYQGSPIRRERMVRLFSTILKREGAHYFLVTPVEKVGITVEDAPFVAVDFRIEPGGSGPALVFVTNVGDEAVAGPAHPLRFETGPDGGVTPYVLIRRNLEARVDRKSFYRLVELGEEAMSDGRLCFGIRSAGEFFPMAEAARG